MNFEGIGPIIAEISNPQYKKNKPIHLAKDTEMNQIKDSFNKLILDDPKSKFELGINKDLERLIAYIAGASGSGKSFFASQIIKKYKKAYPKNEIYLFSSVDKDSSLDSLKINRINLEGLLEEKLDINDFENSMIIMDDIDSISNKKIKNIVLDIANEGLQRGRHSKTSLIFTNHILCDGRQTRHILNEAHSITIFPKSANSRNLDYLLGSYIGLSKPEIQYVKQMDTRPCTIIKSYPQIIMSDHEISFSKDILTHTNDTK